jgi:hypothetical protein
MRRENMGLLIDRIISSNINSLSIIGMAKNAGKTTTLNFIIEEFKNMGIKMSVLSYGRDGEDIDAVTKRKKPKIFIPPETYFATAEKAYLKSSLNAVLFKKTKINTLLGNVNIYKSNKRGGFVELVGVNTIKQVKQIKSFLAGKSDLFLLDGAVDRKSSAVPEVSEAFILATGAVVGTSESEVVKKTLNTIEKLNISKTEDDYLIRTAEEIFSNKEGGKRDIVVYPDNTYQVLKSDFSYKNYIRIGKITANNDIKAVILSGALLNSFLKIFASKSKFREREIEVLVKDGTKIFLDYHNIKLLKKYDIKLRALSAMKLIAVTVNPATPFDTYLNSEIIVKNIKKGLNKEAAVLNIMS